MDSGADVDEIAGALRMSIGLLVRRLRYLRLEGELTVPETSALVRLARDGPTTSAALAKVEQISPQSMGATLGALEARALVERHADAADGRKAVLSLTAAGRRAVQEQRKAGTEALAKALATGFTPAEIKVLTDVAPLIERLAQQI